MSLPAHRAIGRKSRRDGASGRGESRPWPSLTLGTLLALAFGLLVALSVGAVLAMSVRANFLNTISLLNLRAVSLIEGMEREMAAEADQAEHAALAVARLYSVGVLDRPDQGRMAFAALLDSSPTVEGLLLKADGRSASMFRAEGGRYAELPGQASPGELAGLGGGNGGWGVPRPIGGLLFHNVAVPLGEGGADNFAMAFVGQDVVSRVMRQVAPASDATVFLLTESAEVVSHSKRPELFAGRDIRKLDTFPDPILRQLPEARENGRFGQAAESGIRVYTSPDGRHVYLTKSLSGFSAEPLLLGVYFPAAEIGAEMFRAVNSLLIGLGGLILSVVAAIALGRYVARPITQVATAATRFSDFQLDQVRSLPRSHVIEIDDQIRALNTMRAALLQFTRYVPRQLVTRLMRTGEHLNDPQERDITILFTDIIGFTGLAERMSAEQVAGLLNRHFEMIADKVEATGGTIDKFMGDSVMAFWGAPERDEDHVFDAVRAAYAIGAAVRTDNAERRRRGEPVLRVRMGIQTGRAVVGDIGSRERHNYTVIGDAVNVAQRLEQLAKEIIRPDQDAIVLVSSDIVGATRDRAEYVPLGEQSIRGREGPISVCILHGLKTTYAPGEGARDRLSPDQAA